MGIDAVAGLLLLGGFVVVAGRRYDATDAVRVFQFAYLIGFAGYLLVVRSVLREGSRGIVASGRWLLWLAACLALRAALLSAGPSDDLHRYLWEGRIQLAGFNPFQYAPDDPALIELRDRNWTHVGHPSFPAIYPPLAQMVFAAVAAVAPHLFAVKAVFVVLDALTVVVLASALRRRGDPPQRVLIYALCPLVLTAFAAEGHVDSLMLLPLAGVMWAMAAGRWRLAGVLLGTAIAAKLIAAVLLPWFALRRPKAAAIALLVAATTYLPYLGAGRGLAESLVRFSSGPTFMSLAHSLIDLPVDDRVLRVAAVALLAAVCVVLAIRRRDPIEYAVGATGAMLMLMPVVHAWYLTWIVLWMPISLRARWLAAAGAMVVYYEAAYAQAFTGEWALPAWAPWVVWGVFGVTWAIEIAVRRRRSVDAASS